MTQKDVIALLSVSDEGQIEAFALTVYTLMCYFGDVHVLRSHVGCIGRQCSIRLKPDCSIAVEGSLFATEADGLAQAGKAWESFANR